jgi:VanZ family protein
LARFLRPEQIEPAVFAVRKLVHFAFYFTLSGAAWLAFRPESPERTLPRGWYAFVFAILVAIFDEATQSASALRSGKVWDVVLDAAGALAAIFLLEARADNATKA